MTAFRTGIYDKPCECHYIKYPFDLSKDFDKEGVSIGNDVSVWGRDAAVNGLDANFRVTQGRSETTFVEKHIIGVPSSKTITPEAVKAFSPVTYHAGAWVEFPNVTSVEVVTFGDPEPKNQNPNQNSTQPQENLARPVYLTDLFPSLNGMKNQKTGIVKTNVFPFSEIAEVVFMTKPIE